MKLKKLPIKTIDVPKNIDILQMSVLPQGVNPTCSSTLFLCEWEVEHAGSYNVSDPGKTRQAHGALLAAMHHFASGHGSV